MKQAMISQPMAGKTEEEIAKQKNKAIDALTDKGFIVCNTWFREDWMNADNLTKMGVVSIPVYFLARALKNMSFCDAVYFCKGWESARGCRIERAVAEAYGLEIIEEE